MKGSTMRFVNVVTLFVLLCSYGQTKAMAGTSGVDNRSMNFLSVRMHPGILQNNAKAGSYTELPLNYAIAPGLHAPLKTGDQDATAHRGLATAAGWVGTIAYILAYLLLSLEKIKSDHPLYHLFNILGAVGLIWNALHLYDYPNVIVNGVWLSIAIMALILIGRRRIRKKN